MGPVLITLYLEGWVMEALCCKCTLRCTSFRTWYFKCYYNQMLVTVQNMLIFHKHYHYSPKALRELKSIAKSLEKKDTRCVPHISKAAKCVLENYTVLFWACVPIKGNNWSCRQRFIHCKQNERLQSPAVYVLYGWSWNYQKLVFKLKKMDQHTLISWMHFKCRFLN